MKYKLILFISMISFSNYSQVNEKKLSSSLSPSSILKINKEELILKFNWKYPSDTSNNNLNVSFRNNPFNLDSRCIVLIVLGDEIICEGPFSRGSLLAKVPKNLLNKKTNPKLIIVHEEMTFIFSCDQVLKTVNENDNLIHIVFMPTNESENIYFISTDYKLNEN